MRVLLASRAAARLFDSHVTEAFAATHAQTHAQVSPSRGSAIGDTLVRQHVRRRSQVVRQRSAKPPSDGSIPSGASLQGNELGSLATRARRLASSVANPSPRRAYVQDEPQLPPGAPARGRAGGSVPPAGAACSPSGLRTWRRGSRGCSERCSPARAERAPDPILYRVERGANESRLSRVSLHHRVGPAAVSPGMCEAVVTQAGTTARSLAGASWRSAGRSKSHGG